jgi:hypothetical protein
MKEADFFETVTADASVFEGLTVEAGGEISDLVRQHVELSKELTVIESQASSVKDRIRRIETELLPEKMNEMGMTKVEIDGNEVSVSTFVSARLPKDPMQRQQAFQHLRELGCGDFIKNTVSISFPVTQDNRAKALADDLSNQGYTTETNTWVENPTLRKVVKEQVDKGSPINLDLFNGFIGFITKIKGDKK